MPCIERLSIWSLDREWRYLTLCKAKRFSIMDVLPEEGIDLVGIESTTKGISTNPIERSEQGTLQSLQRRRQQRTNDDGINAGSDSACSSCLAEYGRSRGHNCIC